MLATLKQGNVLVRKLLARIHNSSRTQKVLDIAAAGIALTSPAGLLASSAYLMARSINARSVGGMALGLAFGVAGIGVSDYARLRSSDYDQASEQADQNIKVRAARGEQTIRESFTYSQGGFLTWGANNIETRTEVVKARREGNTIILKYPGLAPIRYPAPEIS